MFNAKSGVWPSLLSLWGLLVCALLQVGCTDSSPGQPPKQQIVACVANRNNLPIAPPLQSKTIVAGALPASFTITDSGDAALSIPLVIPPGRAGVEPAVAIHYNSANGDGVLGQGFGISGASAITRCPKTIAIDREIRAVHYDADDAYCLDGKRLVLVAQSGELKEYRTFPDTQVKIIEHTSDSLFETFLPSGWVVDYGKTPASRPLANNGAARAWLATTTRNARGNSITYNYCFAEADGYTAEYALIEIRYTGFDDEEASRAVSFVYGTKDPEDVRTVYSHGMAFQHSLQLHEVQTQIDGELVRRYEFGSEQSEATGRTRLTSAQECGADGDCKPETQFQYAEVRRGFEEITTTIAAPLSRHASYMLGDFNGDGLDDLLVPDTTASSTPTNPITAWKIARNLGNGFAAPKLAYSQEWSIQQDPQGSSGPALQQPELGIALDYNQDGRTDVLLYDVYGSRNNFIVLLSKADGTFAEVETNIKRPFPIGPAPKQLRSAGGAIHLADLDGNGVGDLILCEDHGDASAGSPSQAQWRVHFWQPSGFLLAGQTITTLAGIGCDAEMYPLDENRDGITDLLTPSIEKIGGQPGAKTGTYSVHRRRTNGTWEVFDTNLPLAGSSRLLFLDVNGDGLPDALMGDAAGRLLTWIFCAGILAEEFKDLTWRQI